MASNVICVAFGGNLRASRLSGRDARGPSKFELYSSADNFVSQLVFLKNATTFAQEYLKTLRLDGSRF